jgi:hypothetical protein
MLAGSWKSLSCTSFVSPLAVSRSNTNWYAVLSSPGSASRSEREEESERSGMLFVAPVSFGTTKDDHTLTVPSSAPA